MNIERINIYDDGRFREAVLRQHGAFLADGRPCEFEITGPDSAVVFCRGDCGGAALDELIDTFRFYAGHIVRFYDPGGKLLKTFPPVNIFSVPLDRIQPSQFFVDEEKLRAVDSFISVREDIVIPLLFDDEWNTYISLDGHTRMAAALERGFASVYGFLDEGGDYIKAFATEARRRGVFSVRDMKKLPREQYDVQWNQFCDRFFGRASKDV